MHSNPPKCNVFWGLLASGLEILCTKPKTAEPSEGTRNRVRRDEEPTAEGDGVGSECKTARGGQLDAPGHLFGRPEASNQTARAV